MRIFFLAGCFWLTASAQSGNGFEQDVKPLLVKRCAACHNPKNRTSGLDVLSPESLLEGGNRGPAVQPGNPTGSLILQAIGRSGDLKMPPGGKLPGEEIAKIQAWISGLDHSSAKKAEGAQPDTSHPVPAHWAFQPVKPVAVPAVTGHQWPKNSIDRFVLARLERERISPSHEADSATLLRRVYLDLIGLPPAAAEVEQYMSDQRPDRYERLVDHLLESPHFGERWGRHWLDQVRYADSDGGSRDEPREMWLYRQWVIQSLNRDQPFNEFVIEQLAGDLLPNATPDQRIATGFQRNSPLQIEAGTDREEFRSAAVSDRVDAFGTVLLGLTIGCARCHDHKYDPIRQREYYQLYSFFNNIDEYSRTVPSYLDTEDIRITHAPLMPVGTPEDTAKWNAIQSQLLALYKERFEARGGEAGIGKNKTEDKVRTATIQYLRKQLPDLPLAMVMQEMRQPREAHVLLGGDYARPGAMVKPGVPAFLNSMIREDSKRPITRLDLARWVTDTKNPLLARVAVNRIWQQYFGAGIVETENDFGLKGSLPSHPELLDWLANELVRNGWSRKALHRLIVTSAAYRQSSKIRPQLEERDPANRLLARQSRLRLDAEIVRDSGLAISGLLNRDIGGPSVYPLQPDGVMETGQVKQPWKTSSGKDRYRRGLYTFAYRVTPNPAMKLFDGADGLAACTRRARTDTPLQALVLLNDPNFHEMAQAFARRIVAVPAGDRMAFAFRSVFSRPATSAELARVTRLLKLEQDAFQTNPAEAEQIAGAGASPELAAWTSVSRVLMNTDEFVTRE